jgi:hypothetical protein
MSLAEKLFLENVWIHYVERAVSTNVRLGLGNHFPVDVVMCIVSRMLPRWRAIDIDTRSGAFVYERRDLCK